MIKTLAWEVARRRVSIGDYPAILIQRYATRYAARGLSSALFKWQTAEI